MFPAGGILAIECNCMYTIIYGHELKRRCDWIRSYTITRHFASFLRGRIVGLLALLIDYRVLPSLYSALQYNPNPSRDRAH